MAEIVKIPNRKHLWKENQEESESEATMRRVAIFMIPDTEMHHAASFRLVPCFCMANGTKARNCKYPLKMKVDTEAMIMARQQHSI